jgi:hypothetical protein
MVGWTVTLTVLWNDIASYLVRPCKRTGGASCTRFVPSPVDPWVYLRSWTELSRARAPFKHRRLSFAFHDFFAKRKIVLRVKRQRTLRSCEIDRRYRAKNCCSPMPFCPMFPKNRPEKWPRQALSDRVKVASLLAGAPVAQLDRASASGAEGHRFKSCQAHHQHQARKRAAQVSADEHTRWAVSSVGRAADS